MDYNDNQGYLLGTGDSRANDSGFRLVSKEEPVSLLPPTFGQFGKSQQFSNSSQELFKIKIGPYYSLEEAEQWNSTLEEETEIIAL